MCAALSKIIIFDNSNNLAFLLYQKKTLKYLSLWGKVHGIHPTQNFSPFSNSNHSAYLHVCMNLKKSQIPP